MKQNFKQEDLYQLPAEATLKMLNRLAIVAIIIIVPFAIYNFAIRNYLLGFATSIIIGIFSFNAWAIVVHNVYFPKLTFWLLVPTIIFFIGVAIFVQGYTGILWTYPAILAFYCMLPEKKAYISNGLLLLVLIPCIWMNVDGYTSFRATATMILVSVFSGIFFNVINQQQKKLKERAITDPLTNLLNRALLQDTLEQAVEQSHRAKIPMTIAIFDLDNFKSINDLHGHDLGDKVLQEVAKIFIQRCRKVDRIFRLGGEEFLLFLYNTDSNDAISLAEELRMKIQNMDNIPDVRITASAGLATLQDGENWREWVKRSDEKQYQAKVLGRNRIVA